jgi:hypothetical protein
MSIATLKRKTAAKYNNVSVGVPQFSINGGYRNQGWVGQSSLSRSLIKTPYRGNTPCGHGGCCSTYNVSIVNSLDTCTNNNQVMKSSSLSTTGMIDTKYRWIQRPAPYTSVKPDVNHNLNQQGDYITRIKQRTLSDINKNCPSIPQPPCVQKSCIFDNVTTQRAGLVNYSKNVGPIDQSEYINNTNNYCVTADIEFQQKMNTKPSSTPFGC